MKEVKYKRSNLNHYKILAIVITLYLHSSCSTNTPKQTEVPAIPESAIQQAIQESDKLFAEREDISNLRKAVDLLSSVRDPNKRNFEVEWKYARNCYFLGKMESESSVSEQLFEKGRDAGQIALRLFPDKPHGHFWYAANLGELAQLSPITVGIKAADDIRSEMLKVIEIDPSFQGASAFDALGELELKTRLFGGSVEKAIEYLEKGVEVEPTNSNIRLHLAQAYLAAKRKDDARKQLETIIKMPPPADYRVEHSKAVEEAKKIIEKKF